MKKMDDSLLKGALEVREEAMKISARLETLGQIEKRSKKEDQELDDAEYAYSYIKDGLEGISRIRVALKHADVFMNEASK